MPNRSSSTEWPLSMLDAMRVKEDGRYGLAAPGEVMEENTERVEDG